MNIIIVGCGKVGSFLAQQLNAEGHDIVLIDKNEKPLRNLALTLDVMGVTGNGTMLEVLKEAGLENTGLLIACTGNDEVNMLSCLIAKKEGHCNTICRIRSIEYEGEIGYLKNALGISYVINPDRMCAHEIVRLLRFPSALEIETFADGAIDMVKMQLPENSPICDTALKDLSRKLATTALICMVERKQEVLIPSGNTVLRAGDLISFIARPQEAMQFCRECKLEFKPSRSVFFVGCGKISNYIGYYVHNKKTRSGYKFIDINPDNAQALQEKFPDFIVITGDGSNLSTLREEGIENADVLVALTGIDEENIVLSLLASSIPGLRRITKINHMAKEQVPENLDLGSVVSPKEVTANAVVRFVRGLESSANYSIQSLYKIANGKVEAQEYIIHENSDVTGVPLKDLELKPATLIAAIVRNGQLIQPGGADMLLKDDRVVIITLADQEIRKLQDILL